MNYVPMQIRQVLAPRVTRTRRFESMRIIIQAPHAGSAAVADTQTIDPVSYTCFTKPTAAAETACEGLKYNSH